MKHIYISLGSACDVSMALGMLQIREKSFPFDWLWNLDSGLSAINHMIKTDFAHILETTSCAVMDHYRLPNPQVVYVSYPSIIHMHSNPMVDEMEHAKLLRRISRFQDALVSGRKLHFIYYSNHSEEKIKNSKRTLSESLDKMVVDGKAFLQLIETKFGVRRRDLHLLLILQSETEDEKAARRIIRVLTKKGIVNVSFGYTISRYDDAGTLDKIWRQQWKDQILKNSKMPAAMRLSLYFRPMLMAAKPWMILPVRICRKIYKEVKRILTS